MMQLFVQRSCQFRRKTSFKNDCSVLNTAVIMIAKQLNTFVAGNQLHSVLLPETITAKLF